MHGWQRRRHGKLRPSYAPPRPPPPDDQRDAVLDVRRGAAGDRVDPIRAGCGWRGWSTSPTRHADQPEDRRTPSPARRHALGFTLFLENAVRTTHGQLRNSRCGVQDSGFLDLPEEIHNEAVIRRERSGPFGAKGGRLNRDSRFLLRPSPRAPRRDWSDTHCPPSHP